MYSGRFSSFLSNHKRKKTDTLCCMEGYTHNFRSHGGILGRHPWAGMKSRELQ